MGAARCPEHGSTYTKGCRHCQTSRRDYQQARKKALNTHTPAPPPPPVEAKRPSPGLLLPGLRYVEGDTSWIEHGKCKTDRVPTYIFFPARGDGEGVRQAKAICAECPVRAECLDYAVRTSQRIGVWGGKSEYERRQVRVTQRICGDCRHRFPVANSRRQFCDECAERRHFDAKVRSRIDRHLWEAS
jgi:WhiB family transcriptional regulator, redox-sensing transcriptional regulator